MRELNEWLLSDIDIYSDGDGCFTANHKYQGNLIDGEFYESRKDCRRDAVQVLREKKYDNVCGLED